MYSEGQLTGILRKVLTMPAEMEVVGFKRAENSFPDAVLGTNYRTSRPSLDEMKKRIADRTTNRITFDEIELIRARAKDMDLLWECGFVGGMSGCLCITDMGALLFARNLKDFKHLQFRGLILGKYEGNSNLIMSAEKCWESGYMVEFDDFLDWIVNDTSREHIVVRREKLGMYPKVAIREFLANQIVHQSFEVAGMQLAVEIYDNRIVFTNPGSSLNDVNRLIDLPPHSRNEHLAQMMLTLDICERRGSGMSKNERIQACYRHICLMYERQESVGNVSVRDRFGLNKRQAGIVSHILKDTIDAGLIRVEDPDSESRRYATCVPYYA